MRLAGGGGERCDDLVEQDGNMGRGSGGGHAFAPFCAEIIRGDLLQPLAADLQRDLRIPDFGIAAAADEQGHVLDPALLAQQAAEHDPAAGVAIDLLAHAPEAAVQILEQVGVGAAVLALQTQALLLGDEIGGIGLAIDGEAGRAAMDAEIDAARLGRDQGVADEGGDGQAGFAVHRAQRIALENLRIHSPQSAPQTEAPPFSGPCDAAPRRKRGPTGYAPSNPVRG